MVARRETPVDRPSKMPNTYCNLKKSRIFRNKFKVLAALYVDILIFGGEHHVQYDCRCAAHRVYYCLDRMACCRQCFWRHWWEDLVKCFCLRVFSAGTWRQTERPRAAWNHLGLTIPLKTQPHNSPHYVARTSRKMKELNIIERPSTASVGSFAQHLNHLLNHLQKSGFWPLFFPVEVKPID